MEKDDVAKQFDVHLIEGESQLVEFKERIPDSARDLAENIASFATSNVGVVYLGVDNSGGVVGVEDLSTAEGRDRLQQRVLRIANMVKPQVRVELSFFQKDSKNLVRITIPKGARPVYFVGGIPYLRDLSASRPAEPEEVEELHQRYFTGPVSTQAQSRTQQFLTRSLVQLSDAQLALSDINDHNVNPYLEQLRYDLGSTGRALVDLSTHSEANELGLKEELVEAGKALLDMELHQFYLGRETWDAFLSKGKKISGEVDRIVARIQKNVTVSEDTKRVFKEQVKTSVAGLKNDWNIGQKYRYGSQLEKLRDSFRIMGYTFHRLAVLPESLLFDDAREKLLSLGNRLRTLSTPKGFGYSTLGFDHIQRISVEVEVCIKMGQELIQNLR